MYKTVTLQNFHDAFKTAGCEDNFTREGREKLFWYLEQYQEDTGEEIELDVIALCCEYTESSIEEAADAYISPVGAVRDYIQDKTTVVYCDDDTILYANF